MFTVTAPGADLYPFDPRFCSHSPSQRCSGSLGCRVDPEVARAFNERVGLWWGQLHRAAKLRADRATGHKGKLLARAWEKQKRGLAHLHGVVSVSSGIEQAWAKEYVTAVNKLASRYGFGYVDRWEKISDRPWPGDRAGTYLSSYLVGGKGRKAAITETVKAQDLPRLVVFISRDLTVRTGCTMRSLRNARRLWASRNWLTRTPHLTLDEWLAAALMLSARQNE